ncbi:hypothetical protein [Pseudarthrobacter raffinosi]|uniref:hypothetical protein n=1 Tax=Pseudarthrobacter raffinosi TaxID=2953651 RepID=UPI00208E8A1B|nr:MULTISPECIES: hypothetical protein [unclassified Pseudarthrobacter]MCO4251196.1 hypothetical protein [Pseudarthrobacter sp. MDT3-9]MCO4265084.1 hypothetical protein [Pseudarthrobacter sp. MDT3-26]
MFSRRRIFGLLLNLLLVAVSVSLFVPQASQVAGALMICGATVGITMVSAPVRLVSGILIGVGGAAYSVALALGHSFDPTELLAVNQTLIGMIAAVSFLQLITRTEGLAQPRLSGRAAVWRTTGVVHLLGSVINITVVGSAADHLRRRKPLQMTDALLVSRAFSTGSFWSPFWAASAAALIYAPEAEIQIIMVCGAALAGVAIAFTSESAARRLGERLVGYQGYALSRQLLEVPAAMVVLIVLLHLLAPEIPVAKLVLVCSLAVTAVVLVVRGYRRGYRQFREHAAHHIPKHHGELTLFASAGLLAVGCEALLSVTSVRMPVEVFGAFEAWLCIVVMVALALVGVHPVVSMAALAALVAQLDPDPTLFALATMIGWGCSIPVGPLSGLLLHLGGRYGLDALAIVRGNLPYLVFVTGMAYPTLLLCEVLVRS